MRSRVHSAVDGRTLARRGPIVLGANDAGNLGALARYGIGLDALLTGPAQGNLGTPAQFLQSWLPGVVRSITQVRLIDELIGVTVAGSWADEEVIQTTIDLAGQAELYGDHTNVPLTSYDTDYERRTIVRFEAGMQVGRLSEARARAAQFDEAAEKRAAVTEVLDIARNKVGFLGYNAPDTRTYGLLNDPSLSAYVTLANGASASPLWSTKTYLEIIADIRRMVTDLVISGRGNIRAEATDMTLILPLGHEAYLAVVSEFGVSVRQWVNETYPRLRIVTAPEFDDANGGASAAYIFAESVQDGSSDDHRVITQIVPSRFQVVGSETGIKGYKEDFTNALAGVMVKRPYAVKRYTGL